MRGDVGEGRLIGEREGEVEGEGGERESGGKGG